MAQRFYNKLIRPVSKPSVQAEREVVLNWLLLGILGLAAAALADTLLGMVLLRGNYLAGRALGIIVVIVFMGGLYALARSRRYVRTVALVLVFIIGLLSCLMILQWGLLVPTAILLASLSIVMSGILVNARCSLYVAGLLTLAMTGFQYAQSAGQWHPNLMWMKAASTPGDVIGFASIFFIIAFVSWLFNRQMEQSLRRAYRSEKALQRQKELLEIRVEKRAQQLEAAQLEKMQELYRFAELGRLSTTLFHDLANHLSTVNMDIAGLKKKDQSDIMQRIHDNVGHIDTVVQRVRQQLRGKNSIEVFNVINEINEVIKILSYNAGQAGVAISLERNGVKSSLVCTGDITRFRQIVLNLVSNGIEAYSEQSDAEAADRKVVISLERQQTTLFLQVIDHGVGIPAAKQTKIFAPFYTTKEKGVGIGLFIVQQVVENDFKGSLSLESSKASGTIFTVTLPRCYYAHNLGR